MSVSWPLLAGDFPQVPLAHLDELWFQVGGTRCNLSCRHCFLSCHPHNHTFGFLDLATVQRALEEASRLGVKEYYFTGGEPFLNRDLVPILERTLHYGPATVLTNGTVLQEAWLERLRQAAAASAYRLEFRVSLDGPTPEENDPIRGADTLARILGGVRKLLGHGFFPILTVTRTGDDQCEIDLCARFAKVLGACGYDRPRIKILPTLRLGAEAERRRGYREEERVTAAMMRGIDLNRFLCHRARIVTDRGVFVCPILIEAADARMGDTLEQGLGPYLLRHQACYTCFQHGTICANISRCPGTG